MRPLTSFFVALPMGFLLAAIFFLGALEHELGVPTSTARWGHYLYGKKQALAAQIHQPKLLLVGGSATLFGLSARTIQQETGFPTVNFGTHAGLGSEYILHAVEQTARPGDVVLLIFEYGLYSLPSNVVSDDFILADDVAYFRSLSCLRKFEMAVRVPWKRLWEKPAPAPAPVPPAEITPFTPGVETVDEYGDEIYNAVITDPATRTKNIQGNSTGPLPDGSGRFFTNDPPGLVDFLRWARRNNVRVLATFPNTVYKPQYDLPEYRRAYAQIEAFYASHGVPVLGTAREAMLPEDQFYNDIYHMTHVAAVARTGRLIPYLRPFLKPTAPAR